MIKQVYETTKAKLISAPLPLMTRTYKPISHEQLIDLTLESIYQAGFKVEKESYSSAKEGVIAHGKFLIQSVMDEEMQLQIMWQNSYNKSLTLTFAIGAMVKVCTNGMMGFRALGSFKRKHTGEIQEYAPHMIGEYIKGSADMFSLLQKDRDSMKQIQVSKRAAAELTGRLFMEENIIGSTQLNIIKKELQHPSYIYDAPGSMWELYNFTTFAMREMHPSDWMENHLNTHKFFMNEAGLFVPREEEPVQVAEVIENDGQLSIFDELERLEELNELGEV